jgi:uncharacterized membrane protein
VRAKSPEAVVKEIQMNEVFGFVLFTALLALCSVALLAVAATRSNERSDGQSSLRGVAWALTVVSALAFLASLVFLQAFTSRQDVAFVVGPPLVALAASLVALRRTRRIPIDRS